MKCRVNATALERHSSVSPPPLGIWAGLYVEAAQKPVRIFPRPPNGWGKVDLKDAAYRPVLQVG
jgi:hypothetical protein